LFAQAFGFMLNAPFDSVTTAVIAIVVILILSLINYLGVRYGKLVQNIFFVAKLLPLLIVIFYGLFFGTQTTILASNGAENVEFGLLISGLLFAVARTLFAYEGWTNLNNVVEEMKDAQRDLPKALTIAVLLVMSVYVLFVVGLYRILDVSTLTTAAEGALSAGFDVTAIFGAFGTIFANFADALSLIVFGAIVISIFGALNGSILSFPRVYYAMAQDETMPSVFGKIDAKFGTPWVAILGQTIVSIVIVLLGYNNVNYLLTLILFGGLIFNTLIFFSIFTFRKTMKETKRSYKVWGYPYVPALAIFGMVILLVVTLMNSFEPTILGIFVLLIGNGVYDVFMDKKHLQVADVAPRVESTTIVKPQRKTSTKKATTKKK
jgi:APA family basic amino acid/polyamine antiporter